jgi:hypothetical protein
MSLLRKSSPALNSGHINVSFEFFPPKTGDMESQLFESVSRLAPFAPEFVSVTYGAGGSTKQPTLNTVDRIHRETDLSAAAHLTCVDASKDDIHAVVDEFRAVGVRHFVALRGDPSGGHRHEVLRAASAGLSPDLGPGRRPEADRRLRGFTVSAYPEKHPEAPSLSMTEIDALEEARSTMAARRGRSPSSSSTTTSISRNMSSKVRAGRHRNPDRAGHRAGPELQADWHGFARLTGASVPAMAGGPLRGAGGGRRADAPAWSRQPSGCRAGAGPDRPRRAPTCISTR